MNNIDKPKIVSRHMNQLIFDLKRGFLQFATLVLISEGAKYAYEIKAEVLKITNGLFDIDRNNLYKKTQSPGEGRAAEKLFRAIGTGSKQKILYPHFLRQKAA